METNVEAKKVVVQADESVSPQLMLEKLQKVGACAAWFVLLTANGILVLIIVLCFISRLVLCF